MADSSELSVFEMVMSGLQDSIAFSEGEKSLVITVQMPAPPRVFTYIIDGRKKLP